MALLLGVDFGTSYFKVGLFDETGGLRGLGRVAVPCRNPAPGYAELEIDVFRRLLRQGLDEALTQAGVPASEIATLSYSSQASTFVILSQDDKPLSPLVIWTDKQGEPAEPMLAEFARSDGFRRAIGFEGITGSTDDSNIACMLVCSMHPTVLHEDSTLISADFPGMARQYQYLKRNALGDTCPVLHHTGPAGNQSPRHVTRSNTFDEAQRLGEIPGKAAEKAIERIDWHSDIEIKSLHKFTDLPKREFSSVRQAQTYLDQALDKQENLRKSGARPQQVRTTECDWVGGDVTLSLAKAY